jgi:hypothetical protein
MEGSQMLKVWVFGTRNDLKTFRKWLDRTNKLPPYYNIKCKKDFSPNPKNERSYRLEAEFWVPEKKKEKSHV